MKCNHAEQQLDVLVASNAEIDLHFTTIAQATCLQSTGEDLSAETLEIFLQRFKSILEANPPIVIDSEVYFAYGRSPAAQQQFASLVTEAGIEYTSYTLPEFTCGA